MKDKIKVGIIGAGYMAEQHLISLVDTGNVNIVGICSRSNVNSKLFAAKFNINKIYKKPSELFLEAKADLVIVAVSEMSIKGICEEIFIYPWLIMMEKPIGYNFEEAMHLQALAKREGARVYVGMNRRHYSSTRYLMNKLEENLGARLVQVTDQQNYDELIAKGMPDKVAKNAMYFNSIHLIDYFKIFCRGEIININHIIKWNPDEPNYVMSKIDFSSGDIGIYQCAWSGPGPWSVSISNSSIRAEMRPLEDCYIQAQGTRGQIKIECDEWDKKFKPGLRFQSAELIKLAKGLPFNLPTIFDAVSTMELVSQIYEI